jgi:hypothetical protein
MVLYPWLSLRQIKEQTSRSASSWQRDRNSGAITEGIHWIYAPNTKARILYNRDLIRDWLANGGDQTHPAHKRAIEAYIKSLPSSNAA